MENELNELIAAWRVCQDASPKLDPKLRQNAYTFIESFKTTSTHTLEIGFYLATNEEAADPQQWQLVHFGHQLIMNAIKTKWNEMNPGVKSDVKSRILSMLAPSGRVRPSYLNNSLCLLLIELIKREWPQNWPTLLNDLVELSNRSLELKKLVFIVLKYIAEEFIDTEAGCTAQLPAQRRKDINQYLSSNMESLFGFYLECLEYCYGVISSNGPNNDQVLDMTNTLLDSLSLYMTWLNINLILSRNYSIVNILLNLLSNQKLCVNAAKCLVGLANRKGTNIERMPLLGLFSQSVMQQLLNCTKMSLDTSQTKELMKHLVQILVGMGGQLNYLWQSSSFEHRPSEVGLYLNAIYELMQAPNGMHSLEAINLINTLLQNEFITQDADFQQLISTLSQISSNSYLLIKFSYATMKEYFDDEAEYSKFAQRYRADLSKMIRLSAALNPQAFLKSGIEWAVKIIGESEKLPPNDLTGYDPNSFLYVCWDSLVYLWNNLIQAFTKNLNKLDPADFKSKLLSLVSYSVQLKCRNANYASFNYSFMNALLNLTCDLCDSSERELILKTIIEKLFQDFDQFKVDISNADLVTPVIRQKIFNVRRQICASMLNICKSHSKALVPFMNPIFNRIMEIIGQQETTTQMERSILIQALFFCSNESQSYDLQLSLIKQFITPIFEFFEANKDSLANVDSFIQLIGLDDPVNSTQGINNRRQIFFYVNCLFGILKSINFLPMPCQTLSKPDESTHHHFIAIFPQVLELLRCFNQIHSSPRVNREYLSMTEAIKSGVVLTGQNQEKHQQNELMATEQHSAERILMFVCHTYETLNQLIGLYLSKLKDKLLLVELNQSGQEFVYKFGECVLSSLSDLPPFRIRSIIRYVLKTCLTVVNFDREIMQRNVLLVKLNQVMFEYFLPCALSKINELNAYYKNLGLSQEHDLTNNKQLQTQIAEENQFVLMSREFVDLIRVFFTFNNQSQTSSTTTTAAEGGEEAEDENEVMMENREKESSSSNQTQFSELAINLLQTNKVIYQALILLIFDGLNWPDSQCCFKLINVGSSLLEKYPISANETPSTFTLYMNAQIAQQLFTCCLTALQQHGEHQDAASHLTNLALLVYDRSPQAYRQDVYYRVLEQIPGVNKRSLDEFTVKSSAIDPTSPRKTAALTNQEKLRKDMFKKMLQPIVGKSLGQLYKQEIRIRVLEPLNLKTKRRMNAEDELKNASSAEVNICSLFDPANKE